MTCCISGFFCQHIFHRALCPSAPSAAFLFGGTFFFSREKNISASLDTVNDRMLSCYYTAKVLAKRGKSASCKLNDKYCKVKKGGDSNEDIK
jgi:hypothetical protein